MLPTSSLLSYLSQPFKRAQFGLFHGKMKQFGNNVPFSKKKTRRTWLPNVQPKRLFSDALGERVRVKVTTRALRTIKKYGGLDNYVMKTKADILGWEGMRIRVMVREASEKKAKEGSEVPLAGQGEPPVAELLAAESAGHATESISRTS